MNQILNHRGDCDRNDEVDYDVDKHTCRVNAKARKLLRIDNLAYAWPV